MRIQRFGFAHDVFSGDSVSSKDRLRSNLSAVMRHATAKSVTAPVGGMVIMTDGIINEGLDPLVGSLPPHTPIIAVGAGNTAPRIDAAVGGLLCNEEVFWVIHLLWRRAFVRLNCLLSLWMFDAWLARKRWAV